MRKLLLFTHPLRMMIALYILLAIAASVQAYLLSVRSSTGEGTAITKYNNWVIFKSSHFHLLDGKNLYREYPDEHWDLYKYSPTFALVIGCLAWFPDWLGLTLWNMLNVILFFTAIRFLSHTDERRKMLILLLSAADAMVSLQNSQSNLLVAGLLILGFGLLEKQSFFLATLCIVATFYIKIFGIAALILLLFYPEKRKSFLYALFWIVVLWLSPVVITGIRPLLTHYVQYFEMLRSDQSVSLGMSVMGWAMAWFGFDISKTLAAIAGFAVMCLPLARYRIFSGYPNRILFTSALLIWMVIFNHKAESPAFIIATSAVYIWFFSWKKSKADFILFITVVIFTSLSSTDLFPPAARDSFFEPFVIKVVPCILVWLRIVAELMFTKGHGALPLNS